MSHLIAREELNNPGHLLRLPHPPHQGQVLELATEIVQAVKAEKAFPEY